MRFFFTSAQLKDYKRLYYHFQKLCNVYVSEKLKGMQVWDGSVSLNYPSSLISLLLISFIDS